MTIAVAPSLTSQIVKEQVALLPDRWLVYEIGEGVAALEPSLGWFQIDELPETLIARLPQRAAKLTSAFLPELLATNIQNMPGNAADLSVGWFKKASMTLDAFLTEGQAKETPPPAPVRKQRQARDRLKLRDIRLRLQNAIAGIYPDPLAARKRIERFVQKDGSTEECIAILIKNPTRFGKPHPLPQRWWNPELQSILPEYEEILSWHD